MPSANRRSNASSTARKPSSLLMAEDYPTGNRSRYAFSFLSAASLRYAFSFLSALSFMISRTQWWPGMPVTPPPAWVALEA